MSNDHRSDEAHTTGTELHGSELRRRATAGLVYITSSGAVGLFTGFVGNLILARLLTPEDFGAVALGLTIVLLASVVGDGGLVAGLIRRKSAPARDELRTLAGILLLTTIFISLVLAAIALQFGTNGAIAAVMLASFPISALQAPGRVVLTRNLVFRRIAVIDVIASISFYVWAIPCALGGMGAWAMATGVVVRSAVSAGLFLAAEGIAWFPPRLAGARAMLPTIRFGIKFQLSYIAHVTTNQTFNAGAGLILGVGALGFWTLTSRLMQLPLVLFQSVWHVSFPAMSHVLAAGRDPVSILERSARMMAVVSVLTIAPFAAAAPGLIPVLFGEQWNNSGVLLPLSCLGLLLVGPVNAAALGYLYAANRPQDPSAQWLSAESCRLPSASR